LAHNGFWHHQYAYGRFGRGYHHYGWYGPVFWPYAYGDAFAFALWPYDYYDPFWDYGPDWILSSLFWPAEEPGYYNDGYAYNYGSIYGARTAPRGTAVATESVPPRVEQDACGSLAPGVSGLSTARIEKAIDPTTSEQKAALKDFDAAMAKGADIMKQACPTDVPLTPPAKLDAVTERLTAMKSAIGEVRGPLDTLYAQLSDEQKRRLDQSLLASSRGRKKAHPSNLNVAQLCNASGPAFADLPAGEIQKTVTLDDAQQQKLDQLKTASAKADDIAKSGCISSMPSTVGARLDATEKRVDALLESANALHPAVDDFYASLSDEQKARFNTMSQTAQSSKGTKPAGSSTGTSSGEAGSAATSAPKP